MGIIRCQLCKIKSGLNKAILAKGMSCSVKYIKYWEQIQIQAFSNNQIQIRKILIKIRKYKYVFDPIPAHGYRPKGNT